MCFVSAADRVLSTGHGQLIGTPITLALLGARAGHLAVPVHRPFTLGTQRLELIPSGRGLGAAALHVQLGDRSVLYAGPVRGGAAEVRACDAVVVAAPLGERDHKLAPIERVAEQVLAWVRAQLAADARPVLVVDSALDGLELAARLADDGLPVAGSRSLRDAALKVAELAAPPQIRAPGKEPTAIVRVEADRLPPVGKAIAALVSPRAIDPLRDFAAAFAWPSVADRAQLLAWIEETRARDVYVTGAAAEAIATALGRRARVLGPPQQMQLFPREAAR